MTKRKDYPISVCRVKMEVKEVKGVKLNGGKV